MGLTVGRLACRTPHRVEQNGDGSVSIDTFLEGDSISDVEHQVALALAGSGGRWLPVTATHNPALDGAYQLEDVRVDDILGASPPNGSWYVVQFRLRRFPAGHKGNWVKPLFTTAVRPNEHAIAAADRIYGFPAGSTIRSTGNAFTRASADGTLPVRVENGVTGIATDTFTTYRTALASWYTGSPTLRSGGLIIAGGGQTIDPADWTFDNGLVRVGPPSSPSTHTIRLSCWAGGAWTSAVDVAFGDWDTSGGTVLVDGAWVPFPYTGATVRPQLLADGEGIIRLIPVSPAGMVITIRLRRGDRWAHCHLDRSGNAGNLGVSANLAVTDETGMVRATTGTNRLVASMSKTEAIATGAPFYYVTNSGEDAVDVGIGHEIAGDSAVAPDTHDDLKAQYYGYVTESPQVVAP